MIYLRITIAAVALLIMAATLATQPSHAQDMAVKVYDMAERLARLEERFNALEWLVKAILAGVGGLVAQQFVTLIQAARRR